MKIETSDLKKMTKAELLALLASVIIIDNTGSVQHTGNVAHELALKIKAFRAVYSSTTSKDTGMMAKKHGLDVYSKLLHVLREATHGVANDCLNQIAIGCSRIDFLGGGYKMNYVLFPKRAFTA